jgi:tetratricopeptide (TPR) repeat protein
MMSMNVQDSIDRAYEHSCRGEYDLAIAEYDEILRREPENAFALYQRGYCRYVRRDFDQALRDFLLALRAGPSLLDEYSRYICCVVREVDLDVDTESLLHEYPLFSLSIYCRRAERYHATGQFDQAILAYNEALRICQAPTHNQGTGPLLYCRGTCYFGKEDYSAAIADYDAALALGYTGYGDCVLSQRAVAMERQQRSHSQEQKPEPG